MDPQSVVLNAPYSRRMPAPSDAPPELAGVQTHTFRVRAVDIPDGIPTDANPRDPNLNRQVYRRVRASLSGSEGAGAFYLKHGGIVVIAEQVEQLSEGTFRLTFAPTGQGVVNGGHSYLLLREERDKGTIPTNQWVEVKVHTGVPSAVVPDLADGLNSSMQVLDQSLANLRHKFDWLKDGVLGEHAGRDAIAWREGDDGEYDVRDIIALLMALDPSRYPLENPVGIENTYARVSSVFKSYIAAPERVERFAPIALQALELYEFIRYTSPELWINQGGQGGGRFRATVIAETRKSGMYDFPFLLDAAGVPMSLDTRLVKAAAIPCLAAFRALVDAPEGGVASWRYDFEDIKAIWRENGLDILREVHDAATKQFSNNTHYAGRSPMLYRATTKSVELVDLRRRLAS